MQKPGAGSRLRQALSQLQVEQLSPWKNQQLALALLLQLEAYHTGVVACWAIDGDRLMHCRRLLESITLI